MFQTPHACFVAARLGEQTSNKRQRVASSEEEAAGERLREWEGGGKEGKEVARGNEGNEGNAKTQPQGKDAHAHRAEEEEGEEKERKEDDSSSLALLSTMSPSDLANANFGEYVSHKDDGQLSDLSDSEIEEYIVSVGTAVQRDHFPHCFAMLSADQGGSNTEAHCVGGHARRVHAGTTHEGCQRSACEEAAKAQGNGGFRGAKSSDIGQ